MASCVIGGPEFSVFFVIVVGVLAGVLLMEVFKGPANNGFPTESMPVCFLAFCVGV